MRDEDCRISRVVQFYIIKTDSRLDKQLCILVDITVSWSAYLRLRDRFVADSRENDYFVLFVKIDFETG